VDGTIVHREYPEIECFASIHLLHAIISLLALIGFTLITTICLAINYEHRYTKDPSGKLNSQIDIIKLFNKLAFIVQFSNLQKVSFSNLPLGTIYII